MTRPSLACAITGPQAPAPAAIPSEPAPAPAGSSTTWWPGVGPRLLLGRRPPGCAATHPPRTPAPEPSTRRALLPKAHRTRPHVHDGGGSANRHGRRSSAGSSLQALRRGSLEPGESCEIPGVGPVPLAVARELFGDCFLKFVISDGVDIRSVVHYGRVIPAHLKTALQFRDRCCVVPGCGRTFGLEYDHLVEFAKGGPTSLDNLARVCRPHHAMKTHKGYRLSGGPGHWRWQAPGRPRGRRRRPEGRHGIGPAGWPGGAGGGPVRRAGGPASRHRSRPGRAVPAGRRGWHARSGRGWRAGGQGMGHRATRPRAPAGEAWTSGRRRGRRPARAQPDHRLDPRAGLVGHRHAAWLEVGARRRCRLGR